MNNNKEKRIKAGKGARFKTPTVLQMEAVECGAASLGIILAYYGRYVPLEELRIACGVSRDGAKTSRILQAARRYGLKARGASKDPADLKTMSGPVIIHWNFNHFLVLEGFKKGMVYLNDPACGPRMVSEEEFDLSYTGIVLICEPGPEFCRSHSKPSLLSSLQMRLKGFEGGLLYVLLAGLLLVVPGVIIPIFTRIFVDDILLANRVEWLPALLTGMALTALLHVVIHWMRQYYLLRLETRLAISSSGKFLWHLLHLPVEFFAQRMAGDIGSNRVQINDQVSTLLSRELASGVLDIAAALFFLGLMFYYSPVLTLVVLILALVNGILLKYSSRLRIDQNHRMLQERGKLAGVSMAGLTAIESVKAGGAESDFFAKWAGYQANLLNMEQELMVSSRILESVPVFLTALTAAVVLCLGGFQVMGGNLTIGMLVAFQGLMLSFMEPVGRLVNLMVRLQEVEADLNRLDDVLRYPLDEEVGQENNQEVSVKSRLEGYVEIKDLGFGYSRLEKPLIENFSLKLTPGSRVALVGASGSGKSTVSKLLTGLYRPWEGEIRFDGQMRNSIPRPVLTSSVAMVDQDICLFEGSVRDNISMWDVSIPEADIVQAARDACIHDFVSAQKGGYDYQIQEGGRNFSGGQQQRLEIARALAGNPTILVLDEATSALDPLTEKSIDDNLRRRGCTCLIVAHRLSTIRDCDEIIVMERGKVVQRGTHEEMKNLDGPYRRLISSGDGL